MRRLFFLLAVGALAVGLFTSAGSASRSGKSKLAALSIQPVSGRPTSNPAIGDPPLLLNDGAGGGAVMSTTGPVVVTPIFWHPSGHPMPNKYTNIISTYLGDVAHDSGLHSNVFATMNEYYGSNGTMSYQIRLGRPIDDTGPLPSDSCNVGAQDVSGIYKDGSGYDACIDDDQVIAETERVVAAKNLPIDLSHMYVLFLPKHVESCFTADDTTTAANACTINHYPSAAYCAYHSMASNGMVYGNMPFPIYQGSVPFTCGSNSNRNFGVIETPNGNPDADTEISPTSHEIMEAVTDPDVSTGWYDDFGFENGDECAYVYGPSAGKPGALWNQTIHNHHYLTQEEFSNQDFFLTGRGCRQTEFGH
jgi:hypothetical protein